MENQSDFEQAKRQSENVQAAVEKLNAALRDAASVGIITKIDVDEFDSTVKNLGNRIAIRAITSLRL